MRYEVRYEVVSRGKVKDARRYVGTQVDEWTKAAPNYQFAVVAMGQGSE